MRRLHEQFFAARRPCRAAGERRSGVVMPSLLLVGYGRMGQLVESLAPEYGCDVAGTRRRATTSDAPRVLAGG